MFQLYFKSREGGFTEVTNLRHGLCSFRDEYGVYCLENGNDKRDTSTTCVCRGISESAVYYIME